MTREEVIEELQDKISKNYICKIDDLTKETKRFDLEPYEDVLSPMGWNCCDRCGELGDSELDLMWVDCFPFEDDNEEDQHLLKVLGQEGEDYCAVCWGCVKELRHKKLK